MKQRQLDLTSPRPDPAPVSHSIIVGQPTKLAAIRLAQVVSGLEDKQIYDRLGIDKGQWSRIKSGDAHFPTNLELAFLELIGNDIPLIWLAHHRGYELRPLRSDLERRLAELETQLAQERHDRRIEREYAKHMAGRG